MANSPKKKKKRIKQKEQKSKDMVLENSRMKHERGESRYTEESSEEVIVRKEPTRLSQSDCEDTKMQLNHAKLVM